MSNWPKIAVFIENIFKICKKPYPFEFGGGWGLLMFHKYFLVIENLFKIYKKTYPFEFGGGWGLLVFHKYFLVYLDID